MVINHEKAGQLEFESSSQPKKVDILFRNSVPEIPSTTYGTFGIYKYPAKFIPQVIAYTLKKYGKDSRTVFDPFAGYGTVGVVARVYGFNYILWDLNPILSLIHKTATMDKLEINLPKIMKEIMFSKEEFLPKWSNLDYWFHEDFLEVLGKAWGYYHSLDEEDQLILGIPLLKTTRYFSYSDEKVHKLYRSKYSRKKIDELLKKNWKSIFYSMLEKEILILLKKVHEYHKLGPKNVAFDVESGVDTIERNLDQNVDLLITSPPYLQAQEYIRSTKLELFWLGYKEDYIRELSKKEIPYRNVPKIKIESEQYFEYLDRIHEKKLRTLYERYFHAILGAFERLGSFVNKYMCIFVGPAKIRNISIPIDDIIAEHLLYHGWEHLVTYVDQIKSRVMFESKINPASGIEDSRIKTEHLVVLKKR